MNILFYGDSNTWGFQGDNPKVRLAYAKRFPQHYIIEEGLPGRTICFDDPLDSGRNGMETLPMLLQTHEPLDFVHLTAEEHEQMAKLIGDAIEEMEEQCALRHSGKEICL